MTFEEWADRTFGAGFKEESMDQMLTYFRMSAAWDAALEHQPQLVLFGRTDDGKTIFPPGVSTSGTALWTKVKEN